MAAKLWIQKYVHNNKFMGSNYQIVNGMGTCVKESNGCKFTYRIQLSNSYPLLVFLMSQSNNNMTYGYLMIGTRENHRWNFIYKREENSYPFQC